MGKMNPPPQVPRAEIKLEVRFTQPQVKFQVQLNVNLTTFRFTSKLYAVDESGNVI